MPETDTAMRGVTSNPDLAAARDLIAHGIPVFLAHPTGQTDREFFYPKAWVDITPDEAQIEGWRPGHALMAAAGHGVDIIDIDPKNGADVREQIALVRESGIPIVGMVETPSLGAHLYVPSCGLGNAACSQAGVDYRGRTPEGTGAGMVYLPGTLRPRYDGKGYRWVRPINWTELQQWTPHTSEVRSGVEAYLTLLGWQPVRTRVQMGRAPQAVNRVPVIAMPTYLAADLADLGPEWTSEDGYTSSDRSKRFDELVGRCRAAGLTFAETVSSMEPWCFAMDKFTSRVEREVYRSWARRQWTD